MFGKFVAGSLIYGVSIVLQLVTVIALARLMGPEDFGRYNIYSAITIILIELIALGSGDVLIKQVALRPSRFSALLGHSLMVGVWGLVPATLIIVGVSLIYQLTTLGGVLVIGLAGGIEIAFGRVGVLGEQSFISHRQASHANTLRLIINAIRCVTAVTLLLAGVNVDFAWWIFIQSVSTALSGAIVLAIIFRQLGHPLMKLLPYRILPGLAFSGTQVVRMTQLQVDRLLIGMVASAYVTGIYAAASRVISLGTMPMVTLLRMTYPQFFSRGARGIRAVMPFGLQVLGGLLIVALVTVVAFYLFAPYLPILLGDEYKEAVGSAQLLAPIAFAFAFQYAGGDMLSGAGHQRLRFVSTVLNLFFIAAGILLFAREGGATAVVIAVLGGNAVGALATWSFVIFLFLTEAKPTRFGQGETRN